MTKRLIVPAMWAMTAWLVIGKAAGVFDSRLGFLLGFVPLIPFLVLLSVGTIRLWRTTALTSEQEAGLAASWLYRAEGMRLQAQRAGLIAMIGIWCGLVSALVAVEWGSSSAGRITSDVLIVAFCVCIALAITTATRARPRFLVPPRLRDGRRDDQPAR